MAEITKLISDIVLFITTGITIIGVTTIISTSIMICSKIITLDDIKNLLNKDKRYR